MSAATRLAVDGYLERVRYGAPVRVDLDTLQGLHRAHLTHIPYENLEIQLGRENRLDEAAFFAKLVGAGRGGWCYEMNGTLTAALRELGFTVHRVGGAVARDRVGDATIGNHMVGLVDLDRRYVVDVGLGDGPIEPFPLEPRSWSENDLEFRLERLDDGWWRLHNHAQGLAPSFDFTEEPWELAAYQPQCTSLQTSAESPFVAMALTIRRFQGGSETLRELTHIRVSGTTRDERQIEDLEDYRSVLARLLGTDLGAEVEQLWHKVRQRQQARAAQRA